MERLVLTSLVVCLLLTTARDACAQGNRVAPSPFGENWQSPGSKLWSEDDHDGSPWMSDDQIGGERGAANKSGSNATADQGPARSPTKNVAAPLAKTVADATKPVEVATQGLPSGLVAAIVVGSMFVLAIPLGFVGAWLRARGQRVKRGRGTSRKAGSPAAVLAFQIVQTRRAEQPSAIPPAIRPAVSQAASIEQQDEKPRPSARRAA